MLRKHISYPKINQFRHLVANVNRLTTFTGLDSEGDPIYDNTIKKPILTLKGTTKLHGTNAGVSFNDQQGLWVQSRTRIISSSNDNEGFAFFVEKHKPTFLSFINESSKLYNIDTSLYTITIFGEWAGKGIHPKSNVGIGKLDKSLYIFALKVSKPQDKEFTSYWLDSSHLKNPDSSIYNVEDYETHSIEIDFNNPQLTQNKLIELTNLIEKECPISKALGIPNSLGEGIVWSVKFKDSVLRFKVKGDKHTSSKVSKLAKVDTEKLNSIKEFVDYAATQNRFNQSLKEVLQGKEIDIKFIAQIIKWNILDINKEELDTLIKNNLEPKDVNKYIATKVREIFFETLKIT